MEYSYGTDPIESLWLLSLSIFSKTRKAREKQAQQILSNVDSDGDGKITENEFIDLMHENSKVAAEYFNMLDTDSDGILTIQDIIHHPELTKLNLSTQEGTDALFYVYDSYCTTHISPNQTFGPESLGTHFRFYKIMHSSQL